MQKVFCKRYFILDIRNYAHSYTVPKYTEEEHLVERGIFIFEVENEAIIGEPMCSQCVVYEKKLLNQ